ncbi:hypothetical protein D5086_029950 [Populus alba]|uniref:Uncharacterized protein n=1 Tax=Populus alba TaxID=43335 RepID=A0ACC4AM31_POPAL
MQRGEEQTYLWSAAPEDEDEAGFLGWFFLFLVTVRPPFFCGWFASVFSSSSFGFFCSFSLSRCVRSHRSLFPFRFCSASSLSVCCAFVAEKLHRWTVVECYN